MLINDVPVDCINKAAIEYQVPAALIISVLKTENGRVGQANKNVNGTFDYGPMQINSIWLAKLRAAGYDVNAIQYDPCVNVMVGTWILSQSIAGESNLWSGVGDYHSHTYDENMKYNNNVKSTYNLLITYLD